MVAGPVALFLQAPEAVGVLEGGVGTLSRIGMISGGLIAVVVAVLWLRSRFAAANLSPEKNQTWGCGYDLPNARMQYTGASFSTDFSRNFRSIMALLKRQKAPAGYFPRDSYVITDCADAVERRLYNVIDHGDDTAAGLSEKMREDDPRMAFSAGLAALVIIASLVVLAEGALR